MGGRKSNYSPGGEACDESGDVLRRLAGSLALAQYYQRGGGGRWLAVVIELHWCTFCSAQIFFFTRSAAANRLTFMTAVAPLRAQ